MHPTTLYPKTRQVLLKLAPLDWLRDFYLAGGTALALQLGHRKSQDLDFFSARFPKRELLFQRMARFQPKVIQEAPGTIDLTINEVKVSFLEYTYPLLEKPVQFNKVRLAGVKDIAGMKLSAVSSRGSKKDFVDLFVILKKYSLAELLNAFEKKFQGVKFQKLHLLKSLAFFADADQDPDPEYLEKIAWEEVKKSLTRHLKNYLQSENI